VVRSAALRNLHDLILLLGLGTDAVAPYLLLETAVDAAANTTAVAERLNHSSVVF